MNDATQQSLDRYAPPQNIQAERAVLGGILLKDETINEAVSVLTEDDFYNPAHRLVFRSCLDLFEARLPVDILTVSNDLRNKGLLEQAGGEIYLAELAEALVSTANAHVYAKIVKDKSTQRRLIAQCAQIIREAHERGDDVEGLLDSAGQAIFSVTSGKTAASLRHNKEITNLVCKKMEERFARKELITGVSTGYFALNEYTCGLQPSDLIILAARPSMGKTALAMNIAVNAASKGVTTSVFSLEMSQEQIMMRLLCSLGGVDLNKFRRSQFDDEDWTRIYQAAQILNDSPLYIDDTSGITVTEMRARCRRLAAEEPLGLVIVDYLQLMRSTKRTDSREQEISDISRNLKGLAKEFNVPVLALSQLNRNLENRTDKRPIMSDLRESGAIEQDADLILFLYRASVYNKTGEKGPEDNIAEVIIGKQRNGPIGRVQLVYVDKTTSFHNLELSNFPTGNIYT